MNPDVIDAVAAEARPGDKATVTGRDGLVVTSHPLASRVGADILDEGGNAVDAVLAAAASQLILEPHMTSLTGGLSLLSRHADGSAEYVNGNVHAPLAGLPDFSGADLVTGRGVPVPGWWPAFQDAATRLGTRSVERLLAPAIAIAHHGFPVNSFLFGVMYGAQANLGSHPSMAPAFYPDGHLLTPGERLVQHQAGFSLERLATEGDSYYLGDFANAVVAENRRGGGVITQEDFEQALPTRSAPVTGRYRGMELVASAPPDDGGQMLAEALAMLETIDVNRTGPPTESFETLRLLIQVHNEVYYAPTRWGAPRQTPTELATLLSPEHAARRLAHLGAAPAGRAGLTPGTIHISAVDRHRNAASLTHSHMASGWVNGLFAEGFQLSGGGSFFQRGMPEPGAKAAVYLAPHIFSDSGQLRLVGGSPSVSLVACVLQNIVNIVDFGMSISESVRAPRFGARPHDPAHGWVPGVMIESGFGDDLCDRVAGWAEDQPLWARRVGPWYTLMGNYEGITLDASGLASASGDPRRVGQAAAASAQR